MRRALAAAGYLVLAGLALAGLALSAGYTLISTDLGRALVVPRLVRALDDALAGRIELRSFRLLGGGGIELVGVRVLGPDGDEVLAVERARAFVDASRLRSRAVGLRVELEAPQVMLKREEDGGLSLARAFAPTHPSTAPAGGPPTWTFRLVRLTLRRGAIRYVDAAGRTAFAAEAVAVDGRAAYGPRGARVDASLRGEMTAPERVPVALDVLGGLREDELRVRVLRVTAGDTALDAAAEVDLRSLRGRAAILALTVDAGQVRQLAPRAPLGGDLVGTLYAESDGTAATAALDLRPRDRGGSAEAAAAARLPLDAPAAGLELRLAGLDLSKVLRGAPSTALTAELRARGSGRDLATLRGAAALSLAPSRLRGGRIGPGELRLGADRGRVEVTRLELEVPGGSLRGRGRWKRGAELSGQAVVEANDLASLRANVAAALDAPIPPLAGSARVEATLAGTEASPSVALRATAPALASGKTSATGVAVEGELSGTAAAPRLRVEGTVASVASGEAEARGVRLAARVEGRTGEVTVTGEAPQLGREPVTLHGSGTLSRDRRVLELSALAVAWPGDRFELEAPAHVVLAGPSVDRLALAGAAQRITVEGGVTGTGRRRVLDARLQVHALELDLLPRALLPANLGAGGRIGADLRATGTPEAPAVAGRVELADGKLLGMEGLGLAGEVGWQGSTRRARLDVAAQRKAGGELRVRGDLPLPPSRGPAAAPLQLEATARGWPVPLLLSLARVEPSEIADGLVAAEVVLGGTVGAPTLRAGAALEGGRYGDVDGVRATVSVDDPGQEARLTGSVALAGATALQLEATVPLRTADLLRDPAAAARRLPDAPLAATATVPGLELATLAGRAGIPEDLRGQLEARVQLTGTARAPRGTATAALEHVAVAGYRELSVRASASAREREVELSGSLGQAGEELARVAASLALPPERLASREAVEAAPLRARLDVAGADLRRATAPVPLAGRVAGHLQVDGSLAAPRAEARLSGQDLEVSGHPLGNLEVRARAEEESVHAELRLAVRSGGTLDGSLDAGTGLGLPALRRGDLGRAPSRARLVADQLDLAFLPAVAPGLVRSASGKLGADLVAAGPLARMVPRGVVALEGGRASVAEFGEWTDVTLRASLTEDDLRLERLAARRRDGTLELTGEAKGLARGDAPADVTAALRVRSLPIPRAGQDIATLDLRADLTGKLSRRALNATIDVPDALVKLPSRLPRRIQSLDKRPDIVIGPERRGRPAGPGGRTEGAPYRYAVHLIAPGHFVVKSDSPRTNVELRADVTAEYEEQLALQGDVETVRGQIEPIGGRIFDLKRGRVRFTGGDYTEGALDVQAVYDNPAAKVTVAVTGTVEKPDVKLTSQPPMDESQIAMLIATGQAELKAGSGGVGTLTGEEAGKAALGAVATTFFKDVLADKLPVDSVALDSSQLRAGKYVTDKIYVGYTRRFAAKTEDGENTNEVRVEYQITPRWTFQSRYGDAQTGGASLIWSRDY